MKTKGTWRKGSNTDEGIKDGRKAEEDRRRQEMRKLNKGTREVIERKEHYVAKSMWTHGFRHGAEACRFLFSKVCCWSR